MAKITKNEEAEIAALERCNSAVMELFGNAVINRDEKEMLIDRLEVIADAIRNKYSKHK